MNKINIKDEGKSAKGFFLINYCRAELTDETGKSIVIGKKSHGPLEAIGDLVFNNPTLFGLEEKPIMSIGPVSLDALAEELLTSKLISGEIKLGLKTS